MRRILLALLIVLGLAAPAWAQEELSAAVIYLNTCKLLSGSGSPEGAVTAPVCSTFWRTDGGTVYVKTSGTGNTGWTAVQSAITPAALTKSDDTNVTLTLGGSPSTALLNAASLTLGWTGTLGLTRGGTAASLTAAHGAVVYSTASTLALTAAGSTGQILRSAGAASPTWTTATYPETATTAGTFLRADGTNWAVSALILPNAATANRIPFATALNTWGDSANLTFDGSTFTVTGAGSFTTTLDATQAISTSSQIRAKGWYTSGTGAAAELGFSSGAAYLIAYNRTTSEYLPVVVQDGSTFAQVNSDSILLRHATIGTGGVRIDKEGSYPMYSYHDGGGVGWASSAPYTSGSMIYLSANAQYMFTGSVYPLYVNATGLQTQTGYLYDIGTLTTKWRSLHAAELWVETLVAQNVMSTIGGRVLVAPTTMLTADLTDAATTIYVKHNQMASGDVVRMESSGKVEFMEITSSSGGGGPYSYTVTRNLDGTGADTWYAGDAVLNTGTTGKGFIDLYSTSGVFSAYGPTIAGHVRNSSSWADVSVAWGIGNLNGLYGYSADLYGVGLGKYANGSSYMTIEPTNGIRMWQRSGGTNYERFRLAADGSGFLASSNISWTTAGTAQIASWTLTPTKLYSGSGATYVALDGSAGTIRMWAGAETAASAPFRVYESGAFVATNGTFSGDGSGVTNINGANIQTGTVTANLIRVGVDRVALNDDPGFSDPTAWGLSVSDVRFAIISDGQVGNRVVQNTSGGAMWIMGIKKIPVDPNKTYRVRVWLRETGGTCVDSTYMAVTMWDYSGTVELGYGPYWYYFAEALNIGSTWTEYTGTFGYGTAKPIPALGRLMAAATGLNNAGSACVIQAQDFRIEEMSLGTVTIGAGGYIVQGQTDYNTGTGFWLGDKSGTPKFSLGNSSGNRLTWDGTTLSIAGSITVTGGDAATQTYASGEADAAEAAAVATAAADATTKANTAKTDAQSYADGLIPATIQAPSGSGLFLSSTYMGYYTGGNFQTFIKSDGSWYFAGDASNYVSWNGAALTVKGTVTATSGTIGGWTLGATSLTSGSGGTTVGLDSGGTNPALYAGSATPASAPFRVTNAGALTASNISITGGSTTFDTNGITLVADTVWPATATSKRLRWTESGAPFAEVAASKVVAGPQYESYAGLTLGASYVQMKYDSILTSTDLTLYAQGVYSHIYLTASNAHVSGILNVTGASLFTGTPSPASDGATNLGASNKRWASVWGNYLNVGDTVNVTPVAGRIDVSTGYFKNGTEITEPLYAAIAVLEARIAALEAQLNRRH